MPGTKAGGLKTAATNKARDPDFYKKIGHLGGSVCGKSGGFAYKDNGKKFGRIGGKHSRKGWKLIEKTDFKLVYKNKKTGEILEVNRNGQL